MSDNAEKTRNNASDGQDSKEDDAEDDKGNTTHSRTKRSILDVPPRTNISADGQAEEQFQ
nr:unnamed protein product [Callosobruchus analis]